MSTLQTLNNWESWLIIRWKINDNFTDLNTDKAETSALTSWLAWKQDTITGLTASGAELNILDGATLSTTELNYVDGVTSAIQTQLNAKQATLVSWTNIKTINGNTLLGSGDLVLSGTGDVVWPASSTDNAIARMDGATGKLIQNSTVIVWDTGIITGVDTLNTIVLNASGQSWFSNTTSDAVIISGWITFDGASHRRINDGWSNELIKFPTTSVAGAVNEFTISNAATGNWPILEATGWDTNIDVNITTKGTWVLKVNWSAIWAWNVTKVWTPVNNQIGVWTGDGTLEGDAALTFDTTTDTLATTLITATTVTANLVGNVTGNASWTAATVTGASQTAITSAANLATVWTITTGTWNGTDIAVADWGTWRSTGTTAYSLIATGTTATGAQQTLANGATTEVLVGGGASALPVWTTASGSGAPVRATSPTLVTPLLGTPTSWTLTNCTGLPVAGITASTSTALWVGSIELWHASDTSIARVSAWVISVEGVTVPTISSTSTITNKRNQPRIVSAASYTTDTGTSLDVSTTDIFVITAQAWALLFNAPSGTPVQGEKLIIRIKDNGTARALTWNAVFRAMGTALPSTTVLSKTLYLGFIYNSTDTKWDLVSSAQEA